DASSKDVISIYPNPASSFVSVDVELGDISSTEIIVTNILGEQLFIEKMAETKSLKKTIPVSNLVNGIYFITIKTKQGKSVQKFVKR
ncbi:MAG TPA: T9SS type A sorting domain-containing protein, partial [Bacteroidia bacterium]|nr:T9SS type A sorting domain-containing protein [Bacteroidia bacterium]